MWTWKYMQNGNQGTESADMVILKQLQYPPAEDDVKIHSRCELAWQRHLALTWHLQQEQS